MGAWSAGILAGPRDVLRQEPNAITMFARNVVVETALRMKQATAV